MAGSNNTLFNWFGKKKLSDDTSNMTKTNQIATDKDDGAIEVQDAINDFVMNFDVTYNTHADLIEQYREIAKYNEVDFAIEDIVNEMVSFDDDEIPVDIDLNDLEMSDAMKEKIREAFEKVSHLLDLNESIHKKVKAFYVDGRLTYQKVVDQNNLRKGLQDVIELDPRFVTKVRNVNYNQERQTIDSIDEYFIYDEKVKHTDSNGKTSSTKNNVDRRPMKLHKDSLVFVTSGLTDEYGESIGWLHKAVKPANQLRMMENALVVKRITRAPERRLFYVDTTGMSTPKAKQYLQNLKNQHRNRMSYDPETGSFQDKKHFMTMQEDYWLPRNSETGKNTEIDTLPGDQNLDQIDDVNYFHKRLYKALNIPESRLQNESVLNFGQGSEIDRDELKFSKFVSKIRKRFNTMLIDLLKTELLLTNTVTAEDWKKIEKSIKLDYAQDFYLEERKQAEMFRDRLELIEQADRYIGKYFSHSYARKQILKQSDEEIKEEDKQIEAEKGVDQFEDDEEGRRF